MFVLLATVSSTGCRSEQSKANEGSADAKQATVALYLFLYPPHPPPLCPLWPVSVSVKTAESVLYISLKQTGVCQTGQRVIIDKLAAPGFFLI